MLKSLSIRNYAIIDDISIDFEEGFNVFTGETGAGKSIVVGALSSLLKGRSDTSMIRKGEKKAFIEGVFSLDEDLRKKLEEAQIDAEDDLIVRRIISADNRSSIRVNDVTVTLNFLESLFADKVDIHSQRDSQYLYQPKNHLVLLDRFLRRDDLLKEYRDLYKDYTARLSEYDELENSTYSQRELEFLQYDLEELSNAKLSMSEEEELLRKEKMYKDSEKYLSVLNNAHDLYRSEEGIQEKLYDLLHSLNLDDERIEKSRSKIEEIYYELEEEMDSLDKILGSFEEEDLSIDEIEERLFLYSKLKRKHNTDVKGLLALKGDYEAKIAFYNDRDHILLEKKKEVDKAREKALKCAQEIHQLRAKKAKELSTLVEKECRDLVLPNARFSVSINEKELSSTGIDDVEFLVSMNKGEDLRPLKNVVSGGEASRLLLSLKTVFTSLSRHSLVVFDEIDTGVSGKVAFAIGEKMAKIARDVQVLTITHLSPVAACASSHYVIYKVDEKDRSVTKVKKLEGEEIIEELASISGDVSDSSKKAAEELYTKAQERVRENG